MAEVQGSKDREHETFEARNERIETGVLVKTGKEKNVSVERKQGDCYQWNAKGQCTKGDACSFRHDESKRGQMTLSSSCPKTAETKRWEKFFEREISQRR